jgi:hypothetical protein
LNIHSLVVYSDAKVSIFGKKHSKVDESHLEGQRRERELGKCQK